MLQKEKVVVASHDFMSDVNCVISFNNRNDACIKFEGYNPIWYSGSYRHKEFQMKVENDFSEQMFRKIRREAPKAEFSKVSFVLLSDGEFDIDVEKVKKVMSESKTLDEYYKHNYTDWAGLERTRLIYLRHFLEVCGISQDVTSRDDIKDHFELMYELK